MQKTIIEKYKGLVDAVDPSKIIQLHKTEVEKLKELNSSDVNKLQTQVLELALFVDSTIRLNESMAKSINEPELYNRDTIISMNMPSCAGVLQNIRNMKSQPKTPNAQ